MSNESTRIQTSEHNNIMLSDSSIIPRTLPSILKKKNDNKSKPAYSCSTEIEKSRSNNNTVQFANNMCEVKLFDLEKDEQEMHLMEYAEYYLQYPPPRARRSRRLSLSSQTHQGEDINVFKDTGRSSTTYINDCESSLVKMKDSVQEMSDLPSSSDNAMLQESLSQ